MVGQTASIYRHGGEASSGTIYNYATETTQNIEVTNQHLTIEAKTGMTPAFIPSTTLAAGDYIRARFTIPDGFTLNVWQAGVHDEAWAAPAGLDCWLRVESEGAETLLASDTRNTATDGPIHSVAGPEDVAFQIENGTGAEVSASGYFSYTLDVVE